MDKSKIKKERDINIRIEDDLKFKFKELCSRMGVSISKKIREHIIKDVNEANQHI
jgi:antitoxin component of RelBE/YafQ-DinJ toxin-antitoxin module